MNTIREIYTFAGPFLMLSFLALLPLRGKVFSISSRIIIIAGCAAALFIPVSGLKLYRYFFGLFGQLSVTLFLSLCLALSGLIAGRRIIPVGSASAVKCSVALLGLALYPSAMGLVPWDLYGMGYCPVSLLLPLLILSLWGWIAGARLAAAIPLVVAIAYNFRLLESQNLWDYMLDPFVVVYSLAAVTWGLARGIRNRRERDHRADIL